MMDNLLATSAHSESECLTEVKRWVMLPSSVDSKLSADSQSRVQELIREDLRKGIGAVIPSLLILGYSERHSAHYVFAISMKIGVSPQSTLHRENQTALFATQDGRNLLQRLIRLSSVSSAQTKAEASFAVHFLLSSTPPRSSVLHSRSRSDAEVKSIDVVNDLHIVSLHDSSINYSSIRKD